MWKTKTIKSMRLLFVTFSSHDLLLVFFIIRLTFGTILLFCSVLTYYCLPYSFTFTLVFRRNVPAVAIN